LRIDSILEICLFFQYMIVIFFHMGKVVNGVRRGLNGLLETNSVYGF
jgi:hypothetical protein